MSRHVMPLFQYGKREGCSVLSALVNFATRFAVRVLALDFWWG